MTLSLPSFFSSKKIPTILGITILLVGVVVGVFLITTQGNFALGLKAGPTSTPRQVKFSNISDTSITVSWITDTSVSGFVKYGEGNPSSTLSDNRDQVAGSTGQYTTHYVTLRNLKTKTPYSLLIGSGSQTYDNNGQPYSVSTAPVASGKQPSADTISGKVVLPSGQPAPGVIVFVEIEGASPMSAITKNSGVWSIPLSSTRTQDLKGYLTYDPQSTKLNLTVQGADLGTATAVVTTANDNPVADITLGQSTDLSNGITSTESAQSKTVITQNLITITNGTYTPTSLTVNPGDTITVVNQDIASHSATSEKKEFNTGVIAPSSQKTFNAPLTPGNYTFSDTLNPKLATLKGNLIVQSGTNQSVSTSQLPAPIVTPSSAPVASPTGSLTPGGIGGLGNLDSPEATLSVKLLSPVQSGETVATTFPEIKIQGPVGQKVKIEVHSTNPQSTNVTIGKSGTVDWTPPKGLAPGEHTVTLTYLDDAGVTQTITKTFTVAADTTTGGIGGANLPQYTATPSATVTPTEVPTVSPRTSMPSTASGMPESGVLTPTLVLFTLGIALFMGGLFWQVKIVPKNNI